MTEDTRSTRRLQAMRGDTRLTGAQAAVLARLSDGCHFVGLRRGKLVVRSPTGRHIVIAEDGSLSALIIHDRHVGSPRKTEAPTMRGLDAGPQ